MVIITIKVSDNMARYITSVLRDRYEKDGRATLNSLAKIALFCEVSDESERLLKETGYHVEEEIQ